LTELSRRTLLKTPLNALHKELGARMVDFAGWEMPVQYPMGIKEEHLHTRRGAGLFDVSHMGQARLWNDDADATLETLTPGNFKDLKTGRMRYTQFTDEKGGILDDLMVGRTPDGMLFAVVNAACREQDMALLRSSFGETAEEIFGQALLALQGPEAGSVLARHAPATRDMVFMDVAEVEVDGLPCLVSRSGYTGEDGFEISCPADSAEKIARALLNNDAVEPVGLGARDTLRLEAGLCLYGHDIDETTTPVQAGLGWSVGRRRREEGGFPGEEVILRELDEGPSRLRVGLRLDGKAPAREGAAIQAPDGAPLGTVTSGGYAPSVGGPVAMGYVPAGHAAPGTQVHVIVRDKALPAEVVALPFVAHRFHKA